MRRMNSKKNSRAFRAIVQIFGGAKYAAFNRWAVFTRRARRALVKNFANLATLKRRQLVKEAYHMWLVHGVAHRRRKRILFHSEAIAEIERKQIEIAELEEENSTWELRSHNRGKKKMTAILYKHLKVYFLRKWFNHWASNINRDNFVENRLIHLVSTKYNRRCLRVAFTRYIDATRRARRSDYQDYKGEEYREIIQFRALRRMFRALKSFWSSFHLAKVNLRKALKNTDHRSKKSFFELWLTEVKAQTKNDRKRRQNLLVEEVQGAND